MEDEVLQKIGRLAIIIAAAIVLYVAAGAEAIHGILLKIIEIQDKAADQLLRKFLININHLIFLIILVLSEVYILSIFIMRSLYLYNIQKYQRDLETIDKEFGESTGPANDEAVASLRLQAGDFESRANRYNNCVSFLYSAAPVSAGVVSIVYSSYYIYVSVILPA